MNKDRIQIKMHEDEILRFVLEHPGVELFSEEYEFLDKSFYPVTNALWEAFDNLLKRGIIKQENKKYAYVVIDWLREKPYRVLRRAVIYPSLSVMWDTFKREKHDRVSKGNLSTNQ